MNTRAMVLAVALAALAACATPASKPAVPAAPVVEAPPPAPAPAPEIKPVAPAPTPAPKAVAPAPAPEPKAAAATPAPAAPAPAPAAEAPKKRKKIALGLPALATLKEEVGLNGKQGKAAKAIYDEYKPKLDEAAAKIKEATDKKAANKEIAAPLKKEVLAKLREICADDAQKAKFDALMAPAKKKPATP